MTVVIAAIGMTMYLNMRGYSTPSPAFGNSEGTTTTEKNTCGGCIGLADNGRVLTVVPTSRLTLELPETLYDENRLSITPSESMGETFGASASVGNWVRTFEAVVEGTSTIFVPAKTTAGKNFTLTVRITPFPTENTERPKTVTQDVNGKTIHFKVGDRFLLDLGELQWNISLSNDVISRVKNIAVMKGAQGIYTADKKGTETLTAIGAPICNPGSPCPQFRVRFEVIIIVE